MTSALVLAPLLVLTLLFIVFVPVLVQLLRRCPVQEVTADWLENFSVASYYPMEGLLSDEDFQFLSRQPGFDLSLYRKLRRERLHIFKQYLNRSIGDFNRLHTAIRTILPYAPEDCSDVAARLIWLRLRFSSAVFRAELSYRLGVLGYHSLAVRSLIRQLEEMNLQLSLVSAARPSA